MAEEEQLMMDFGDRPLDPVSGNPIPPGASAEEVRDDVDIKASKNEYIIPANVVRFIGLDKLEKMVKAAQKALTEMEENGRMGKPTEDEEEDDDLPFSDEELMEMVEEGGEDSVGMAAGGSITSPEAINSRDDKAKEDRWNKLETYEREKMGNMFSPKEAEVRMQLVRSLFDNNFRFDSDLANQVKSTFGLDDDALEKEIQVLQMDLVGKEKSDWYNKDASSGPGQKEIRYLEHPEGTISFAQGGAVQDSQIKIYVNEQGQQIPITFINGQPTQPIPSGYKLADPSLKNMKSNVDKLGSVLSLRESSKDTEDWTQDIEKNSKWKDPTGWDTKDFSNFLDQGKFSRGLSKVVGVVAGPIGEAIGRGYNRRGNLAYNEILDRLKNTELSPEERTSLTELQTKFEEAGYKPKVDDQVEDRVVEDSVDETLDRMAAGEYDDENDNEKDSFSDKTIESESPSTSDKPSTTEDDKEESDGLYKGGLITKPNKKKTSLIKRR